jgi:hypothetical protein
MKTSWCCTVEFVDELEPAGCQGDEMRGVSLYGKLLTHRS